MAGRGELLSGRRPDDLLFRATRAGVAAKYRERAAAHKELIKTTPGTENLDRHFGYAIAANAIATSENKVDALVRLDGAKRLLNMTAIRTNDEDIKAIDTVIAELEASNVKWGKVSRTKPTVGDMMVTFMTRATDAISPPGDSKPIIAYSRDEQDRRWESYRVYMAAARRLFTYGDGAYAQNSAHLEEGWGFHTQMSTYPGQRILPSDSPAYAEVMTALARFEAGKDMPEFIVQEFRKHESFISLGYHALRERTRSILERRAERRRQGGILATDELQKLIKNTDFVTPKPEKIDAQSFDVHLGTRFEKITGPIIFGQPIDPSQVEVIEFNPGDSITLGPGEALIGKTVQKFKVPPNYFALIDTNGGPARALTVTVLDFHIDGGTGWNEEKERTGEPYEGMPITLQLVNHRTGPSDTVTFTHLGELHKDSAVARIEVFTTVGKSKPYTGHYNFAEHGTIYSPSAAN